MNAPYDCVIIGSDYTSTHPFLPTDSLVHKTEIYIYTYNLTLPVYTAHHLNKAFLHTGG